MKYSSMLLFLLLISCYSDNRYDEYVSEVEFSVQDNIVQEYILEIRPLEERQYIGEQAIWRDDQEEFEANKFLYLTDGQKVEVVIENDLLYNVKVFEIDPNADIDKDKLREGTAEMIYEEEFMVDKGTKQFIIDTE
ncbi:hypothetical protein [Halalkalibacter sp. APA_J-10(15)]|uniref:hypothetical protein n=1 Tax=Halalkalibacter sp. APA_J-10(15) TaxID=2933805 RepID=UPI001FF1469E|nr:hypothetical protein [Halalkalibacter sp. APA_J-10(15)]MCK0473921.1 hypothetical protein [Halalkalibacter sp. APA_J-10(15)]